MKRLFKNTASIIWLVLALIAAFVLAGCGRGGYDGISGAMSPEGGVEGDADADTSDDNVNRPYAKQLTAAAWNDAQNYEFWLKLFQKDIEVEGGGQDDPITRDGIFSGYAVATRGLDSFDMHEVSVTYNGEPVAGASVKLYNGNELTYSAMTDSAGAAYVFGYGTSVTAASGEYSVSAELAQDGATHIELDGYAACANELEIMLVVDTTGSMGDELSFLCDELAGVVTRVSEALDCNIRLGLLFYRDVGDKYVTRAFDFAEVTSESGLKKVVKNIKAQSSSGGGDYPEAVDRALSEAVAADWHTTSKTRLIFHVLDAPYHDEQDNQSNFASAVQTAAEKGIRIIPVAASGLDTLGQYIMRSAALLTGGTYTFLTDDSGIGFTHELPAVGEFTVEYLSDLMVRLIKGYYTGTFDAPIPWTQDN